MSEETAEQKLARYETVLDLQMKELDRLREENERLRAASNAHSVLREIYLDRNLPESLRAKAAQAALPHETPRLMPEPRPLDLVGEEVEDLATLVHRRRARQNELEPPHKVIDGQVLLLKPNGNAGGNSDDHS